MKPVQIISLIGVSLLALVSNVIASVLYMVIYGYVIDPGHDPKYYQDHIQVAGPYCSIIAGIPIMFFAGWWVAGWWRRSLGVRGALTVWFVYGVIDLSLLLIAGLSMNVAILFVVSFATKLAAVYWGATTRLNKPVTQTGEPEPAEPTM